MALFQKSCGGSCNKAVTVRPTCGGRSLCLAPWLAIVLVALFILVLFVRCNDGGRCCDTPAAAGAVTEPTVTVLMYHHLLPKAQVGALAGNNIVTYVESFEQQLQWMKEQGYQCITAAQLQGWYDGGALPEKAVLITFDDGYLSNAEYAAPLLRQYGGCATVFLVTGVIGEGEQTFSPTAVQMMTRETLEANADVLEYAGHTDNMHHADGYGHSMLTLGSTAEVCTDLTTCLETLKALPNNNAAAFSYPYGFVTEQVKQVLTENGVKIAFRADSGHPDLNTDRLEIPRFPVDSSVSMEHFIGYFA